MQGRGWRTMVALSSFVVLAVAPTLLAGMAWRWPIIGRAAEAASAQAELTEAIERIGEQLSTLNDGVLALRRAHPEIDGLLEAHAALDALESFDAGAALEAGKDAPEVQAVSSAVRALLDGLLIDGDLETTRDAQLSVGTLRFVGRLRELVLEAGMTPGMLELSELEARRLGELAYRGGHADWARACYEEALRQSSMHPVTLDALCHIAREQARWADVMSLLDRQLELRPDDEDLLRERAHLRARQGDGEAVRDIARLEALGKSSAADRSILSGIKQRSGDRESALRAVDEALDSNPQNIGDWRRKAELHEALDQGLEALEAIDKALALDRQDGDAWGIRARLLASTPTRRDEALKAAVHAAALGAGGVETILLKARLLADLGRMQDARDTLQTAVDERANDAALRAGLAELLARDGHLDAAIEELTRAPAEALLAPDLHLMRGRLLLARADRHREGDGAADRALVEQAGEAFAAALTSDRECGLAWLGQARVERQLGSLDQARRSLERAGRLIPEEGAVMAETALLELERGDLDAAGGAIEQAQLLGVDTAVVPYVKGNIAGMAGRLREARHYYDQVLELDPGHVRARLNRATVHTALDDLWTALEDHDALIEAHPELVLARLRRGELLMRMGEFKRAETALMEILEDQPQHVAALRQLGATRVAQGRSEEALQPLNDAISIEPESALSWHQRALAYLEFGHEEAALGDLEQAVKHDPTHLDSLLHRAAILHNSKDWSAAEHAWRSVLDVDPEHKVARQRMEQAAMEQVPVAQAA